MEGLCHPFAHQWGLAGVFEDHCIPGDQSRGHGVDRSHIGVVPWCHDQDHPMWNALDHAAKGVAVFDLNRGKRVFRDFRHVGCAFVEPAKLPAIADGAAHLMGQFRNDLVVHRAHVCDALLHQRNPLLQRQGRPGGLRCLRRSYGRAGSITAEGFPFGVNRSVNRRDTSYHAHALSKPRAISQSVTTRSNSSCSTSAQRV